MAPSSLNLACFVQFSSPGPHYIWGSDEPAVPGPGDERVTAFAADRPSAWKDVQKNRPGQRPHHPWRSSYWDPCPPFAHGPSLLELTWTIQTREVNVGSSHSSKTRLYIYIKGPILHLFSDLYFSSQTLVEQPSSINKPQKTQSRKQQI